MAVLANTADCSTVKSPVDVIWNIADVVSSLVKWQTTVVTPRVSSTTHHFHLGIVKVSQVIDS